MNANCTRCSARTSVLAPTSTSVTGSAGNRHLGGERRAQDAAVALDVEQRGGERGAGRTGRDERVGVAGGDGLRGADDRGLGVGAGGGGGVGLLGDRQRGVDHLDPGTGGAKLGGRTEQQHAHALGGGDVRARGDLGGAEVGAVGVDGDDRDVMRLDCKPPVRAVDQRPDAWGRHPPAILSARGRAPEARRPRGRRTCRRPDRPDADGGGCGSAGTRCTPAPPSCAGHGAAPCGRATASASERP